jgi:hypothetical protein
VTRKRKRRGSSGSRAASAGGPVTEAVPEKVPGDDLKPERQAEPPSPGRRGGLFGAGTPSPFPSLAVSVARGMRAVGSSPLILATAFISLLATWGVLVAVGVEVTPRFLAVLMSVPPSNLFFDVPVAFNVGGTPVSTIVAVAGLGLLRTVTYGFLIILITQALQDGSPDGRAAIRRLAKVGLALFSIYLLEVALVVVFLQVLVGFLGQLSILGVAASIYFLVFAAIVAAAEGATMQEALRRGFRAARLPGTRHLGLIIAYFLFWYWLFVLMPFGGLAPATPNVSTWSFALVATFIHSAIVGAFVFRWLAVREEVPQGARRPTGKAARSR